MIDDNKENLNNLDKRIKEARIKENQDIKTTKKDDEESPQAKKSAQAGSEFLANIFAGALLGFSIDWYFSTTPWAMMFFLIVSFISGVYRANTTMKKNSEENTK